MSEVALLFLQVSTSIAAPSSANDLLLHPIPHATCRPTPNEITVCARNPDTYRLSKAGPAPEQSAPPKAEWRLFGNALMGVNMTERSLPQGASAPAATVTIKVPF